MAVSLQSQVGDAISSEGKLSFFVGVTACDPILSCIAAFASLFIKENNI